jgi:hypothetical protein
VSIQFSNVEPPVERIIEKKMDADLPAYARLRAQGLQPPTTRNSAELEKRANTQMEVEMGKLIAPDLLRRHQSQITEGMSMARDAGYGIDDIRGWKKRAAGADPAP